MRKALILLLILLTLCGCGSSKVTSFDGKDRPSSRGKLQVVNNQLCGEDGQPIILRGISTYGLPMAERYVNEDTVKEISSKMGANVIRYAMYTYGVGVVGYCTGGDKNQLRQTVENGVEYAKNADMYAIIDWHILDDGDPNKYIDEAKDFFATEAEKFKDYDNIIYEICNEPNHVEWPTIKKYAEVIIPIIQEHDPDALILVGTPDWSQGVDVASQDPLEFDNILYSLHFYAATHNTELRNRAKKALDNGIGIFVTEFGITASTGSGQVDIEESDNWINFLEENGVSYVMWEFSKTAESSAALKPDCLKTKDFERDDFSTAGQWLIDTIEKHNAENK